MIDTIECKKGRKKKMQPRDLETKREEIDQAKDGNVGVCASGPWRISKIVKCLERERREGYERVPGP